MERVRSWMAGSTESSPWNSSSTNSSMIRFRSAADSRASVARRQPGLAAVEPRRATDDSTALVTFSELICASSAATWAAATSATVVSPASTLSTASRPRPSSRRVRISSRRGRGRGVVQPVAARGAGHRGQGALVRPVADGAHGQSGGPGQLADGEKSGAVVDHVGQSGPSSGWRLKERGGGDSSGHRRGRTGRLPRRRTVDGPSWRRRPTGTRVCSPSPRTRWSSRTRIRGGARHAGHRAVRLPPPRR